MEVGVVLGGNGWGDLGVGNGWERWERGFSFDKMHEEGWKEEGRVDGGDNEV